VVLRAPVGSWLGVLAVAAAAAWLGAVGFRDLAAAGDVGGALAAARGDTVGPALLATVVALFVAERRWPAVRRPALSRAHLVDAGYLALFAVAVLPLLTLVQTGFAVDVQRYAPFLRLGRLPLVPQVAVVAVVLVGMDAMNWLAHLANHRSAALWRLHALHHSQEDMSVFTTFRTHPLVHASYLPAMVPALVLGASGTVPAAALVAYGCLVTLPHANLRWTFGPLGKVVVSPAYHRLHHARELADPRRAVNLGFVLVYWDQLARRAAYPTGQVAVATGLAGRPVPVEQAAPDRTVRVVLAQLAQPFRVRPASGGPS
jgi:sterol desaturase/sphingolipid hydroxylase (fatty acid hydroxylase superfamily)